MNKIVASLALIVFCMTINVFAANGKPDGWGTEPAGSDGGSPDEREKCLVTTDFYIVNLTAYQDDPTKPPQERFKPYCSDIPGIGKTYLTVDLLDLDVRTTPVRVEIVEEKQATKKGEVPEAIRTLVTVEPKIYKHGVVEAQANFDKPGYYAMMVLVGDVAADDDKIRVPLRVGLEPPSSLMQKIIPVLLLAIIISAGYFYNRKKQQTS